MNTLRIGALLLNGICQTNDHLITQLWDHVHIVHVNHRTLSLSSVGWLLLWHYNNTFYLTLSCSPLENSRKEWYSIKKCTKLIKIWNTVWDCRWQSEDLSMKEWTLNWPNQQSALHVGLVHASTELNLLVSVLVDVGVRKKITELFPRMSKKFHKQQRPTYFNL